MTRRPCRSPKLIQPYNIYLFSLFFPLPFFFFSLPFLPRESPAETKTLNSGSPTGREIRHQRPSPGIQAPSSSRGDPSMLPPHPPGNFAAVPPSCAGVAFAALFVILIKVSRLCHKVVTWKARSETQPRIAVWGERGEKGARGGGFNKRN